MRTECHICGEKIRGKDGNDMIKKVKIHYKKHEGKQVQLKKKEVKKRKKKSRFR